MEYTPTPEDINKIKEILTWDNDKHDNYIATMLELLLDDVVGQTNNDFGGLSPDGTIRLPGGVIIYMAKVIELNLLKAGVKGRSMGSVSYTYDMEVPESARKLLRPYKRLKFHATR